MTPELTDLVYQSLPEVLALQDRAPALFQEQFVALDPAPRPVFAGADLRRQGAVLIHAVTTAVAALRSAERDRAATVLCQYHPSHGIEGHHFRSAGRALVRTFEQELGSSFTTEWGDAWTSACEWVGEAVLEAPHPMAA
jgi:hemoglobin-like flavoprotein